MLYIIINYNLISINKVRWFGDDVVATTSIFKLNYEIKLISLV
jgi:hypothetical protein